MRIWSVHPKYLDAKGLVALWRETLLAKNVLLGKTKGYKNHPQLNRFKATDNPVSCIDQYLSAVYHEALERNYKFDKDKINWNFKETKLTVNRGQLMFERSHLLHKLEIRDRKRFSQFSGIELPETNPLFRLVEGDIEDWEIVKA